MQNLQNLLQELDNHHCVTQETVMLTFKLVEKKNWEMIMQYLQSNPKASERQIQNWLREQIKSL